MTSGLERIGVVGMGIMGSAYARNLLRAGFSVVGHDVASESMTALEAMGGEQAQSNAEVGQSCDVVLVALPDLTALHDALSGPGGLIESAHEGQVVIEMGTFALEDKRWARDQLEPTGAVVLDAPVSGTGLQAEAGDIVIFASGDPAAIERARPIFEALGRTTFDLGQYGNGSKMKYLANLLISVHNVATAETFVLGTAAGLDPARILEVISSGVGSSRVFEIRGPMIVADDYPPAARLSLFLKDIDVIGRFARDLGVPTPMLDASLPWYREAVEAGLGELDAAAVARMLADRVGS